MKRAFPLVLSLLVSASVLAQTEPNLILFNGRVFVPNSSTFAEAVAIKGNRIAAVGTNAEIGALAPNARKIDLQRHLVIPGINDAHVHFEVLPPAFVAPITPDSTLDQAKAAIAASIDETPANLIIFGTIGPPIFFDPNATRQALDAVAPGRQVILRELTGHGAILSTAALTAFGITPATSPVGGFVQRDSSGNATGKVLEYAQFAFERQIADSIDDASNQDALSQLDQQALRFGITTLQVMPTMAALKFDSLVNRVRPRVRIRVIRVPITDHNSLQVADNRGGNIRAARWILDGTPVERGAALREDYAGTQQSGLQNFSGPELKALLSAAVSHQEQPVVDAAGDRAIKTVLDIMRAMALPDWPAQRLRIEHGDGMQRDLIGDAATLGVVVVQTPTHLLFHDLYPTGQYMLLKTLAGKGIHLAFGSDGALDPYQNLQLAVRHPQLSGEKLSLAEALTAYTAGSAFAEKVEHKGTIAPGELADLAVLSRDLFKTPEQMGGTESILTIVNGKIAFDAGVLP
jgi:predicted amidohydrolase YtcJ